MVVRVLPIQVILQLEQVLEILHQYHHHKEIMVDLDLIFTKGAGAVVPVLLDLEKMVGMDHHHLFLDLLSLMLVVVELEEILGKVADLLELADLVVEAPVVIELDQVLKIQALLEPQILEAVAVVVVASSERQVVLVLLLFPILPHNFLFLL